MNTTTDDTDISSHVLRNWPLPMPDCEDDKEARGHILIIAGSREMPGAVLLAATAALRAGAGKLTIITAASVAVALGVALPEARVIGLQETNDGGLVAQDGILQEACDCASAVLIGPGMQDESATSALTRKIIANCVDKAVILDAAAMNVVRLETPTDDTHSTWHSNAQVILTPHAGEMAYLTSTNKSKIEAEPEQAARRAAMDWNAIVALKGSTTFIASPDGQLWRHRGGNTGLATSGSGDVLAGLIAGLAARGAALEQAAAWGVALHALAGEQLSLQHGPLGYLARDISAKVPPLLRVLGVS